MQELTYHLPYMLVIGRHVTALSCKSCSTAHGKANGYILVCIGLFHGWWNHFELPSLGCAELYQQLIGIVPTFQIRHWWGWGEGKEREEKRGWGVKERESLRPSEGLWGHPTSTILCREEILEEGGERDLVIRGSHRSLSLFRSDSLSPAPLVI